MSFSLVNTLKPRGERLTHARTIRPRTHAKFIIILAILQSRVYKNKKFCIFI